MSLEIYKYKLDSKVILSSYNKIVANFLSDILPLSICIYTAFVDIITKNKAMYK